MLGDRKAATGPPFGRASTQNDGRTVPHSSLETYNKVSSTRPGSVYGLRGFFLLFIKEEYAFVCVKFFHVLFRGFCLFILLFMLYSIIFLSFEDHFLWFYFCSIILGEV